MKMYYFTQMPTEILGPTIKINAHVKIFNEAGIETILVRPEKCTKPVSVFEKLLRRIPGTPVMPIYEYNPEYKNADAFYIRFAGSDLYFTNFLKKLRVNNKNAKIILEFPDFPYAHLLLTIARFPLWIKDRLYCGQYKKYVDRVADLTELDYVYGIKTINFINGVVVDGIAKKGVSATSDDIHMIGVAAMWPFHGYDRIIEGLHEFYQKGGNRNIVIHLVGRGTELGKYKQLTQKYNLQQHVVFYGNKTGQDLDEIYDRCDIGIEVLALHRRKLTLSTTLKSREYWAKGLPFISECRFPKNVDEVKDYIHIVPQDESPVDISKVVEFYDKVYLKSGKNKQEIIDEIRDFAYRTCDMKVAMKPIIDYIKS